MTVQGGLVPTLAHRLRIPLRTRRAGALVAWRPLQRGTRGAAPLPRGGGRPADGSTVGDLPCGENAWVSLVIRDGALLTVTPDITLLANDDVLVLADPDESNRPLERFFTDPVASHAPQEPPLAARPVPLAGTSRSSCAVGGTRHRPQPSACAPRVAGRPQLPTLTRFRAQPPDQ